MLEWIVIARAIFFGQTEMRAFRNIAAYDCEYTKRRPQKYGNHIKIPRFHSAQSTQRVIPRCVMVR